MKNADNKIKSVTFFKNGNTMVFNESGNQMLDLQESWILLWVKHAESLGYDVTEIKDVMMPDGKYAQFFKIEEGYNWRLSDF